MDTEIPKERSTIETTASGLTITIPARKNHFTVLFVGFWLVGWVFGEITALAQVLSPEPGPPEPMFYLWLTGWTLAGVLALYIWLWNLIGKEVITVSKTRLQHVRDVAGYGRAREYDLTTVSGLRAKMPDTTAYGLESLNVSGGTIAFDYGHSTHSFGTHLDGGEAEHIVAAIKQRINIGEL